MNYFIWSIKKEDFILHHNNTTFPLVSQDYNSSLGMGVRFLFNIAKYTDISQLLADFTIRGSILTHSTKQPTDQPSSNTNPSTPYLLDTYFGLRKNIWKKSHSITIRPAIGFTAMSLNTNSNTIKDVSIATFGPELEIGYTKLISPHISLFMTITKKWGLHTKLQYTYNDTTYKHSPDNFSLGGLMISAGVELHF